MNRKNLTKYILLISLFGVAFSGWLTLGTIFSGACPLSGECPYFLGYPACDYGLIMFLIIFASSIMLLKTKYNSTTLMKIVLLVSLIGIAFSGYFSIIELLNPRPSYTLLLPSCVYGLTMYVIIMLLAIRALKVR